MTEPSENTTASAGEPFAPQRGGRGASVWNHKQWWEQPGMPFQEEPGRKDNVCLWLIILLGVYSMALLPFRAVLITMPYVYATLAGSRTAVVMIGALAAPPTENPWWPLGLILATVSICKFDWVYFWAGKLWGRGLIEMVAGRSPRSRRNAERAEEIARRHGTLAMAITFLPVPLPASVIYAALAAAGMSWRRFLILDVLFGFVLQSIYMYLGYRIGEPAVKVVKVYADYAWYVVIAIIVFMVVSAMWRNRRQPRNT
ncbi:DedA family protein [Propioniferax innocua]|uniref:Membrane protein DedA with SNARE-associated domain n=1 Tax=Propioniferax innocua TaxID=1753 RepID=A0A542ZC91_9ACTN|nr:VTT domain-containing protein [Propioniferax innocua]TQL57968.1 membrane protein DedA with SNARE-associated domain [Propioniferax innocua]